MYQKITEIPGIEEIYPPANKSAAARNEASLIQPTLETSGLELKTEGPVQLGYDFENGRGIRATEGKILGVQINDQWRTEDKVRIKKAHPERTIVTANVTDNTTIDLRISFN